MSVIIPLALSLLMGTASNLYLYRVQKEGRLSRTWKSLLAALVPVVIGFASGTSPVWAIAASSALLLAPLGISAGRYWSKSGQAKRNPKLAAFEAVKNSVKSRERSNRLYQGLIDRLETRENRSAFGDFLLDWSKGRLNHGQELLQNMYLQKGVAENDLKGVTKDMFRFISVSRVDLPDGRQRYEVGYDIPEAQLNVIKKVLTEQLGVNVLDPEEFRISEYRNHELGRKYGAGREAMFYDLKDRSLETLGASLNNLTITVGKGKNIEDVSIVDFVDKANQSMHKKGLGLNNPKEAESEGYPGGLHMEVLGTSAVSISMNGVCLAYAIADENGKIKLQGTDGLQGPGSQKKLVNNLAKQLKDCGSIQEWCNKAKDILTTPENIQHINQGMVDKKSQEDTYKSRQNTRNRILNMDKKDIKSLANAIKR